VRMFRQLLTESFHARGDRSGLGLLFFLGALSLLVSFAARFTPRGAGNSHGLAGSSVLPIRGRRC